MLAAEDLMVLFKALAVALWQKMSLTGNMPTEKMLSYFTADLGLNQDLERSLTLSSPCVLKVPTNSACDLGSITFRDIIYIKSFKFQN